MENKFTHTLDSVIDSYVKSIVEPIKKESKTIEAENNTLWISNSELNTVISNLRVRNEELKNNINYLLNEINKKEEKIRHVIKKKEKIKMMKKSNEIALFKRISELVMHKNALIEDVRMMTIRNKELYEYSEELKKALNNELASIPLDALIERIRFVPLSYFIKTKIKMVFNREWKKTPAD